MALTTAQKISLFEILESPYAGYIDQPVDDFHLSAIRHNPTNVAEKVQTKVNSRLLELTTDEETKLKTYITQWEDLGTCIASVDGSIGGVNGLAYDPNAQRKMIQTRVKNIIPVALYYSEFAVDSAYGGAPFMIEGGR